LFASTSTFIPSFKTLVAILVPITQGFFNSLATIAAWDKIPPASVTIALDFFIKWRYSGRVIPVTKMLFSSKWSALEGSWTMQTFPWTFPLYAVVPFSVELSWFGDTVTEQSTTSCTANTETQCNGNDLETCNAAGNGFQFTQTCTNGCTAGACDSGTTCQPGNQQCFGDVLKTCNAAGDDYESPQTCQHGCTAGACDAAQGCTEGDLICRTTAGPMDMCDANGNWVQEKVCGFVCQGTTLDACY